MSTIAERFSIFSVIGLGFKAVRSKIKPLIAVGIVGFLIPLILMTAVSWFLGIRGVKDLAGLLAQTPPHASMIAAIVPFAARWISSNLLLELILGSWILISYLFAIRILLDYFVMRKTDYPESLKSIVGLFFRKVLFASLIAVPLLIFTQVAAFLGLFVFFMLMMLPVLIQIRKENGFRIVLSSIFLTYVREMKLSRLEIAILLMSLGGIMMFSFYGMEYLLAYLKHLDVYHEVPQFLMRPLPAFAGLNLLTILIELFESVGISVFLVMLAGTTVSAYAKMEQESIRRELRNPKET